jgi:hypothetical protein
MKTPQLSIRVPDIELRILERHAKKKKRTKTDVVREFIRSLDKPRAKEVSVNTCKNCRNWASEHPDWGYCQLTITAGGKHKYADTKAKAVESFSMPVTQCCLQTHKDFGCNQFGVILSNVFLDSDGGDRP